MYFSRTTEGIESLELNCLLVQLKSPKIKSEQATQKNCLRWKMVLPEESSIAGCGIIRMQVDYLRSFDWQKIGVKILIL